MMPCPKRGKLKHKPYTDWIKEQPDVIHKSHGHKSNPVVPAHQRQLGGGGTALKPPDFHALPMLKSDHDARHNGNDDEFSKDEAADLCLHHAIRYYQDNASLHEKIDILDMLNSYAIQWGV